MPSKPLSSLEELCSICKSYPEVYVFLGYGERAQYADVREVLAALRPHLEAVRERCGGRRWLAVYGGDIAREDAPDLGWLCRLLQAEQGADLLAVQSAGAPDEHTEYHYAPEQQLDEQGGVLYGGTRDGVLVGGSRVYLAPELTDRDEHGRRLLTGVFAAGGGGVANQELQYVDRIGLPWVYVPSRARNEGAYGSTYGPVHSWVEGRLSDGRPVSVAAGGRMG
ncbi:hypothetical protein HYH03_013539 [Edaphochlamys debaryana]|uniref:Uncharacterized protein n=1 Tax=Edaphochlamys debaryana TaxID=47281 RepID=A0A835XQR0_9CHLO|nr:hypothetical protein HYH03_013539 [Edaphochlamys debaryana]|eukprot:KAG2487822.1 hypothetical protein HYH03_013539 [Edaphochlamys debaryana]